MEYILFCQVCSSRFPKVNQFKKHLFSSKHKKKMGTLFLQSSSENSGSLPCIAFVDPNLKYKINKPVVGLSMLTLCFSTLGGNSFYLCHVCEKVCLLPKILDHIFSEEHYSNFLSNTNPDELNFSWIPNMDMEEFLFPKFKPNEGTTPVLQILELPKQLFERLLYKPYSEVMNTLKENAKLYKKLKDFQPKRTDIYTYQSDSNRKHPLLGMQHIVECIAAGPVEKKRYLCTLCTQTVAAHGIIKHILSFDHIYCFINKCHPHTLKSKNSYTDYKATASVMLDFARQMERIHGTTSTMTQVLLQPDKLKSANFSDYCEALKSLTSMKTDSFSVSVAPGQESESRAPPAPPPSLSHVKCTLLCQNCSDVFPIKHFLGHLSNGKHFKIMNKYFSEAQRGFVFGQKVKVYLALFTYVCDRLRLNQPTVGTSLVVTCISSQMEAEPFSLCFACQESFLQSHLSIHFESRSHLINTLMYLNPWRLPFGCQQDLDENTLRLVAREEEEEGGGTDVILKVLDLPYEMFWKLTSRDYKHVMYKLQVYQSLLKRGVPKKQTLCKLQQNEKFPLLGMQFLVVYTPRSSDLESVQKGHLCLLCQRKLMPEEAPVHVFSREHVVAFLNAFHPGSLNSSTVDAETLLDLAKQAGSLHPLSSVQEFCLDKPIIEPCSYQIVTRILGAAKRREGKGSLEPVISAKMKLVPRNTGKVLDQSIRRNEDTVKPGAVQIKEEKAESHEKQLETDPQMSLRMCPNAENAENQIVKVKTEVLSTEESSKESGRRDKSSNGKDRAQTDARAIQKNKQPSETEEKKRKSSFCEPSQAEKHEDSQRGTSSKRPRLASNIDDEVSTVMPECEIKKEKTIEGDINKVSSKLLECRCGTHKPIYLCGRCMLRISGKDILSHMTGFDHQEMVHEVFYTDEKMFVDISKQSFQSAFDTLLWLGFDLSGQSKPPITSDPLCAEGSPHPQTMTQNNDAMDIDSEDNCDAAIDLFIGAETFSRTIGAQMECGEETSDVNTHLCDASTVLFTGSDSPTTVSQSTSTEPDRTTSNQKMTPTKLSAGPSAAASSKPMSKSVTELRLLERTESASKDGAVPAKAALSSHAEGVKLHAKIHSSSTRTVKNQINVPAKMPTKSNKPGNTDPCARTAHRTRSVEANADNVPHADERSQHPAGHPKPSLSTRCRHKSLHKEPLHLSASKTSPSGNQEKVGTNHLIVVSWDGKQQVYCMLCSVKLHLSSSLHLVSTNHQYNYVKRQYPEWTAKPSELESKLNHTVALLAKIERDLPHSRSVQKLKVTKDVYQDLGCLLDDEAVQKVKAMVRKKDPVDSVSSSVHYADEVPDPCEVSSSDDVQAPQTGTTGTSDHDVSSESGHQSEDHQIGGKTVFRKIEPNQTAGKFIRRQSSDELPSNVALNQSNPEPIQSPVLQVEDVSDLFFERPNTNLQETQKLSRDQVFSPKLQPVTEQRKLEQGHPVATAGQEALPKRVFIGGKARASNNLSLYLKAKLPSSTAVIGKSCIWECQGINIDQKTFFLCDCCEEKVFLPNICQHMISSHHQLKYLERDYPEYLQKFWYDEELLLEMKLDILNTVVLKLSNQEHEQTVAAQCVCLSPELHGFILSASFSEALKIIQSIKDEDNRGAIQLPISVPEQERAKMSKDPKAIEDGGFSSLSSSAPDVFQTPGPKDACDLEASTKVGRMELDCSSSNLDPVLPDAGSPHTPQSLYGGSHPDESTPAGFHSLDVNEEEESLKSSPVTPTVSRSLNVPVGDESSSSRKRPADTSGETLFTISSQKEDPVQAEDELNLLKAKAEASSPPSYESILPHPAPGFTLDSPTDENLSAVPKLIVLEKLISVLKKSISITVKEGQSVTVPDSELEQKQVDNSLDRLEKDPTDDLECSNQPGASDGNSSSVADMPTLPVQDESSMSQNPSDSTTSDLKIPESSGTPEIRSTAVCQSPIKTIISARQKPAFPSYQTEYQGEASRGLQSSIHTDDAVAAAQSSTSQSQMTDVPDEPSDALQYAANHAAANSLQKTTESLSQTSSHTNQAGTAEMGNYLFLLSTGQSYSSVAISEGGVQGQLQHQRQQVHLQQQVRLQQHRLQEVQVPLQQQLHQYGRMTRQDTMQQYRQQMFQQQQAPQQQMFQQQWSRQQMFQQQWSRQQMFQQQWSRQQMFQQYRQQQQQQVQQHLFQQQQNYNLWTGSWQS
ncbi:uncharacterized protein LOC112161942 isoform X2 [Oryzias melastigma]|uniref:uncharacterized protein LOC112161942 isoform X2 n=1 Tax=Oryzias melastigma TaxID=30732 RepID=UPI000CF7BE3F|nr:uncharacterized protein LOC112161942 isoform X2 [Oryzias melastigma]